MKGMGAWGLGGLEDPDVFNDMACELLIDEGGSTFYFMEGRAEKSEQTVATSIDFADYPDYDDDAFWAAAAEATAQAEREAGLPAPARPLSPRFLAASRFLRRPSWAAPLALMDD